MSDQLRSAAIKALHEFARHGDGVPVQLADAMIALGEAAKPTSHQGAGRFHIDVNCSIIPGEPMPEYARRWPVSAAEWEAAGGAQAEFLAAKIGAALGYAHMMMNPSLVNVVTVEWVWY